MSTSTPNGDRKRKAATLCTPSPKRPSGAIKGAFGCALDETVPPHTLILGTQPSDTSLGAQRYYDFHANAMWHIVGDALGWRRAWLDGNGRSPPASITRALLHSSQSVDNYHTALAQLTSRGYCLWDVLKQSERTGSLDSNIQNAQPADVRGLVAEHPTISRICLASGASTAKFFKRFFRSWLAEEGAFRVHPNRLSQSAFGSIVPCGGGAIELVVMESVSPAYVPQVSYGSGAATKRANAYAAAGYPHLSARACAYAWKRQQWFDVRADRRLGTHPHICMHIRPPVDMCVCRKHGRRQLRNGALTAHPSPPSTICHPAADDDASHHHDTATPVGRTAFIAS